MKEVRNWKRLLAFLIDAAIVDSVIVRPLNKIIENPLSNVENIRDIFNINFGMDLFVVGFAIGVIGILYWSILEYNLTQTIGAMIFGIKVKSIDNKKISFNRMVLRNLSKISSGLLLIDSIHIYFSNKKQRYLEKVSGTVTMEER